MCICGLLSTPFSRSIHSIVMPSLANRPSSYATSSANPWKGAVVSSLNVFCMHGLPVGFRQCRNHLVGVDRGGACSRRRLSRLALDPSVGVENAHRHCQFECDKICTNCQFWNTVVFALLI